MLYNPSTSKVTTAQGAGMPNQSNLNNPASYNSQGYNTFPKNSVRPTTQRFADFKPVFCMDSLEGDVVRLRQNHDIRSFTLKNPQFSNIKLHMDYFQVPWSAILPNTWEHIYKIPVKGDDIPDNFQPLISLPYFFLSMENMFDRIDALVVNDSTSFVTWLKRGIYAFLQFYAFVGKDSLLKNLGYSFDVDEGEDVNNSFFNDIEFDFDKFILCIYDLVDAGSVTFEFYDNDRNVVYTLNDSSDYSRSTLFNVFDDFCSGRWPKFEVTSSLTSKVLDFTNLLQDCSRLLYHLSLVSRNESDDVVSQGNLDCKTLDLKRVFAYQMVCAQYVSNPNIDDISSAKDWLENLRHNIRQVYVGAYNAAPTWDYPVNGKYLQFDVASNYVLDRTLCYYWRNGSEMSIRSFSVMCDLFYMKKSLRSGDYFLNSRLEPLAVGDVDVAVENNKVSAININKNLWLQRLLNAVNRASQNIYDYLWSMTGIKPERIEPQPNFIINETYNIGVQEIENTAGTNEGSGVTSLLRSSQSQYLYEVFVDEPSVIIGCASYSCPIVYPEASDRSFQMQNRYDWFNQYMQHIGDQEVGTWEIFNGAYKSSIFGYQLRFAEFKNVISHATGGFCDDTTDLQSWLLLFDDELNDSTKNHISSEILRNHNSDFDKFYSSLTGFTPARRFHFVELFQFICDVNSKQQSYPTLM